MEIKKKMKHLRHRTLSLLLCCILCGTMMVPAEDADEAVTEMEMAVSTSTDEEVLAWEEEAEDPPEMVSERETDASDTLAAAEREGEGSLSDGQTSEDQEEIPLIEDESEAAALLLLSADASAGNAAQALSAFTQIYQRTGKYLAKLGKESYPQTGSVNGEWHVIGLVRSSITVDSAVYQGYYANAVSTLQAKNGVLHAKRYSDYSRMILGMTSIGVNVTDIAGYNLLEWLADFDQTKWQGLNGSTWALIALDSHRYEIPDATSGKTRTTRALLIEDILSQQLSSGGWDFAGKSTDSDMTAMTLQALAPYYTGNLGRVQRAEVDEALLARVKQAVDKALTALSGIQLSDGGFATYGNATSESASQVLTALCSLGINPMTDSRFIKNGYTVLEALEAYARSDGQFSHISGDSGDAMATEQAFYAMAAYDRFLQGKTTLYDMTDVAIEGLSGETDTESDDEEASENESSTTKTGGAAEASGTDKTQETASEKQTTVKNDTSVSTEKSVQNAAGTTKSANLTLPRSQAAQGTTSSSAGQQSSGVSAGQTQSQRTGGGADREGTSEAIEDSETLSETAAEESIDDAEAVSEYIAEKITEEAYVEAQVQYRQVEIPAVWQKLMRVFLSHIGKGNHASSNKVVDLCDNDDAALPWYIKVVIEPAVLDQDTQNKLKETLGDSYQLEALSEITFINLLNGCEWHPTQALRLKIRCGSIAEDETIYMLHVSEDGIELLRTGLSGDYALCSVIDFSAYGLVRYQGGDLTLAVDGEIEPFSLLSGWGMAGMAAAVLLAVLLMVRIVSAARGRRKKLEG